MTDAPNLEGILIDPFYQTITPIVLANTPAAVLAALTHPGRAPVTQIHWQVMPNDNVLIGDHVANFQPDAHTAERFFWANSQVVTGNGLILSRENGKFMNSKADLDWVKRRVEFINRSEINLPPNTSK